MTPQEAIQELKEDKALYETENCYAGDGSPDGNLMLALDMGIKALEKQIEDLNKAKQYIDFEIEHLEGKR